MLEDAVQGWLEVASQQNELAPDKQLIELSLWNLFLAKHSVKSLSDSWKLKRITGSHHIYAKEEVVVILSIPVHSNRDLPTGTLRSILKDAGITEKYLQ